jgi:hypothetical protein
MEPDRRCDASAALGAVVWLAVVALADVGLVTAMVLLAVLVTVPAALPLAATPRRDGSHARPYRWATAVQPVAAAAFAAAAVAGPGRLGAALTLPWVGTTLLLAWFGLWRVAPRGLSPHEETLLDAGLLYLPVGALAALAWRLELGLGYGLTIVHLTAAHYHYATFLLPVVAAALGRSLDHRRLHRYASVVLVAGVPLVAVGITASPLLEAAAATVFAAGVVAVASLFADVAGRAAGRDRLAAACLFVAAVSVGLAMALAVAYALGQWLGVATVTVGEMVPTHGLLNALGFALPAVVAWRRLAPETRASPPGIPFDTRTARGWVGPDYPERNGLAGDLLPGQVDAMQRYAGERFVPDRLDERVARFYERTVEYRLTYRARWHAPFDRLAPLAMAVTGRLEQLNLPTDGGVHEMVGRCPRLDGEDPRQTPRFWVRTDPETDEGVFVATYGVHERDGVAYMTIGMPLPGANLSAVLVPGNVGAGLELSSVPRPAGEAVEGPDRQDDAGLYLVVPHLGPLRLPVYERFRVWSADADDAPEPPDGGDHELTATHDMWVFGRRFLSIRYGISRDPELAFEAE